MAMKIDPITTGDVPILEQLASEYNRELAPQETRQEAVNRWITAVAEATAAGRRCFWLARVQEQITGFISFRLSTNPFTQETSGFIEDLYIAPPFRRRGEASELARAAFVEISRQGASKIQLDVLVNNEQGFLAQTWAGPASLCAGDACFPIMLALRRDFCLRVWKRPRRSESTFILVWKKNT